MFKRITISIDEEDAQFLGEHPEISPSGLLRKAISDYKSVFNHNCQKQEDPVR